MDRGGPWRRPVCDPGGLCDANLAHPTWNQYQQRLRSNRSYDCDGGFLSPDLSGGRFILGLGSSHKVQVEPEHGVAYGKPLSRTRETVAIVRALIRDSRVRFDGETVRIENFDLWYTPQPA